MPPTAPFRENGTSLNKAAMASFTFPISVPVFNCPAPFRHAPLHQDKRQIRLVRFDRLAYNADATPIIQLEVDHHNLEALAERGPSYTAVSYVWGSDEGGHRIHLGGGRISLGRNLFEFLRTIQPVARGYFWIDQLCIDQQSTQERNHQVQLMSEIFSRAEQVYAWLGCASSDSGVAMCSLNAFEDLFASHHRGPFGSKKTVDAASTFWLFRSKFERLAVVNLLTRDFWSRVWIVQELYLATRLFLICGTSSVELRKDVPNGRFSPLMDGHFAVLRGVLDGLTADVITTATDAMHLLDRLTSPQLSDAEHTRFMRWSDAVMSTVYRKCRNPRDHVYGIQACLHSTQRLHVDYDLPIMDLFRAFIVSAAERKHNESGSLEIWSFALSKAMGLGKIGPFEVLEHQQRRGAEKHQRQE